MCAVNCCTCREAEQGIAEPLSEVLLPLACLIVRFIEGLAHAHNEVLPLAALTMADKHVDVPGQGWCSRVDSHCSITCSHSESCYRKENLLHICARRVHSAPALQLHTLHKLTWMDVALIPLPIRVKISVYLTSIPRQRLRQIRSVSHFAVCRAAYARGLISPGLHCHASAIIPQREERHRLCSLLVMWVTAQVCISKVDVALGCIRFIPNEDHIISKLTDGLQPQDTQFIITLRSIKRAVAWLALLIGLHCLYACH